MPSQLTKQRQQAETSFSRIWTRSHRSYSSWLSAHWKAVARIPKSYQRYPSSIALGVYTGRMEEEVKHLSFPDRRRGTFRSSHSWDPKGPSGLHKRCSRNWASKAGLRSSSCIDEGSPGGSLPWWPVWDQVQARQLLEKMDEKSCPTQSRRAATPCRSPSAPSTSAQRQKATVVERDSAGPSVPRLEDRWRSMSGFPLDGVGPVFGRFPD